MKDIEEMINIAQAEEEQERNTNWGESLRQAKDKEERGRDSKVSITLDEYLVLKAKEMDLDRILSSILDRLTLSYDNEYLTLSESQGIVNAFRVLFPEAYEKAYEIAIDKYNEENKEGE